MGWLTVDVECPKCGAKPGHPCVTASGKVRVDYPHLARQKRAVAVAETKSTPSCLLKRAEQ